MSANFQTIATGVDVAPIMTSLQANPDLWGQFPIRTTHPGTPHHSVKDILIRFNSLTEFDLDDAEARWLPASDALPVQPLIYALLGAVKGDRIGRVVLTYLAPGQSIDPHADAGAPVSYYQRFHIALQNPPEAVFTCGDQTHTPNTGDVFIFDNSKTHSVTNNSPDTARLTLIVDVRTDLFEHIKQTHKQTHLPTQFLASRPGDPITYQVESFCAVQPELVPFAPLHWAELAVSQKDVPLDMDWARFANMDKAGNLHTVTVRKDGVLIGYHISLIGGHLHYKSTKHAIVDLYYLLPEHRKGGIGVRMFAAVEDSLKRIGVCKVITGTKLHSDNSVLFERLGYQACDKLYWKVLNPE